jgi:hypothetical protein
MFARFIFAVVDFAPRKGLADAQHTNSPDSSPKQQARRTGVPGETYTYWYLRRHGYGLLARNHTRRESRASSIWLATTGRFSHSWR